MNVKQNSAGVATRQKMIQAAELLFAERGIEAATLKQISLTSGQLNSSAIQYHFGGKDELVGEILAWRFAQLETARRKALRGLAEAGRLLEIRPLFESLFRARVDLTGANGAHTFAKFMMEFRVRYSILSGAHHPFDDDFSQSTSAAQIVSLIRAAIADVPPDVLSFRLRSMSHMLDALLVEWDARRDAGREQLPLDLLFSRFLDMATAAAIAPATPCLEASGPTPG